jgi:hypothetical protein
MFPVAQPNMLQLSAAPPFGCVQAHDSDYVSVQDYVHVHVQVHVHVHVVAHQVIVRPR